MSFKKQFHSNRFGDKGNLFIAINKKCNNLFIAVNPFGFLRPVTVCFAKLMVGQQKLIKQENKSFDGFSGIAAFISSAVIIFA